MTIKHLYPNVRPSLDLRFAKDKVLDPRITYSRASSGTCYDSTGLLKSAATNEARFDHDPTTGESLGLLVEEARTNYDRYSSSQGQWTTGELIKQPYTAASLDGSFTATEYAISTTNADHYAYRLFSPYGEVYGGQIGAGVGNYTFSTYIKPNGHSKFVIMHRGGSSGNWEQRAAVDLSNPGTITYGVYIYGNPVLKVQEVGNGWYRLEFTLYTNNWVQFQFFIIPYDTLPAGFTSNTITWGSYDFAGDGTSGFYLWGSQIEVGTFATSHIPTPATFTSRSTTATYYDSNGTIQTAGINVARDNAYFPDENGVMRPAGLLLEEARTNRMLYSEDFVQTYYTKSQCTVATTSVTSPDGVSTAHALVEDGSNDEHYIFTTGFPLGQFTTSVFVKAGTRSFCYLNFTDSGANTARSAYFDLTNGSFQIVDAPAPTITLDNLFAEKLPNGWWRIGATVTAGRATQFILGPATSLTPLAAVSARETYQGVNGNQALYMWGAQSENSQDNGDGLSATSYIPTTSSTVTRAADVSSSSTVTRSADVAQITGTNFSSWYNQNEGTFYASLRDGKKSGRVLEVNDNTDNNRHGLVWTATNSQFFTTTAGSTFFNSSVTTATNPRNSTLAYKSGSYAGTAAGLTPTTNSGTTVPSVTQIWIGGPVGNGSALNNYPNGTISRLTYYPVRLPDATLQTLTS